MQERFLPKMIISKKKIEGENVLLSGKTAIVTGSNRGIGKAITEIFAINGANVWACARKSSPDFIEFTEQLAKDNNVQINPLYFDLIDEKQMKDAIKSIRSAKQPVDILVNNAGAIFTALFQMTSVDKMKELFDINFFSQIKFSQYIIKLMIKEKKGSVINIASSAAYECNEGRMAYAATKSAVITSSVVMSRELGLSNIRVNGIAPGLTQTDMMELNTPKEVLENVVQRTSLRRVGQPKEIANTALFLASEMSSFITGQVLRVDGGL